MTMQSFRGEGDLMVDALVAASQAAYVNPNGGQPMPGYGRDLVPFFDDDGIEAGGARDATAPAAPAASKKTKASKSKQAQKKVVPPPKAVLTKNGMTYVQQVPNPQLAAAAKPAAKAPSAAGVPKGQRWAGPAFSNSPAPDALPVPVFARGKAPAAPAGAPASARVTGDAGADIMAMLGQAPPPSSSPPTPHAVSAPDLMAMLNIVREPEEPAPAPAPAPVHRVPSAPIVAPAKSASKGQLLTPDMLAAMTGARGAPKATAADRSAKLLSMRAPAASAPTSAPPAAAPSADFQRLLAKLDGSA
jgi:hypothetical protein